MKKTNNKGFSLVELIIVIAIMAVLIAVLAPQFLRYVERSRLQSDNTAIGELANAIKVASSVDAVNTAMATGTIAIPAEATGAGYDIDAVILAALKTELETTLETTIPLRSNTYAAGVPAFTVTITDGVVTVSCTGFVTEVGVAAAPRTF